jgi:phosphoribosylanthranilate isomerase
MIRPKIKICGITQKEQGIAIAELGADALGFILYPKSPRYLTPDGIKQIVEQLPPFTKTVGVFVNESIEDVASIILKTGLDLAQLSGEESPDFCTALSQAGISWIKSFRVKKSFDFKELHAFPNRYFLLDAWSADEYGGTGTVFDWGLLNKVALDCKIILAGGINSENVERAIRQTNPYAIDISSGVEERPGIKSLAKVENLINQVHSISR